MDKGKYTPLKSPDKPSKNQAKGSPLFKTRIKEAEAMPNPAKQIMLSRVITIADKRLTWFKLKVEKSVPMAKYKIILKDVIKKFQAELQTRMVKVLVGQSSNCSNVPFHCSSEIAWENDPSAVFK